MLHEIIQLVLEKMCRRGALKNMESGFVGVHTTWAVVTRPKSHTLHVTPGRQLVCGHFTKKAFDAASLSRPYFLDIGGIDHGDLKRCEFGCCYLSGAFSWLRPQRDNLSCSEIPIELYLHFPTDFIAFQTNMPFVVPKFVSDWWMLL